MARAEASVLPSSLSAELPVGFSASTKRGDLLRRSSESGTSVPVPSFLLNAPSLAINTAILSLGFLALSLIDKAVGSPSLGTFDIDAVLSDSTNTGDPSIGAATVPRLHVEHHKYHNSA